MTGQDEGSISSIIVMMGNLNSSLSCAATKIREDEVQMNPGCSTVTHSKNRTHQSSAPVHLSGCFSRETQRWLGFEI